MGKNSTRPPETGVNETVEAQGLYLDEYEKIVKPNRLFLIPNYFIHHWVQRLGPTLAWIVVSIQQACWRTGDDHCTISQAAIAEEIGLERRTVGRVMNEVQWRPWYIPQVEYQRGITDEKSGIYYPSPHKYTIYLSTPLIPEHLAGLYAYFQEQCPPGRADKKKVSRAIDDLLLLRSKEALARLESYPPTAAPTFETPRPIKEVITLASGLELADLSPGAARALRQKISNLHLHLTGTGKTVCRQYFRLNWVARLGPSLAWLVMILRSRCYYNPNSGELRDTYTWPKKELATLLGQSTRNLSRLVAHDQAPYFFQILERHKYKLRVRVAMAQEPLPTERPADFWNRQYPTKYDITPPKHRTKYDSTPSPNRTNSDMTTLSHPTKYDITPLSTGQNVTPPVPNQTNSDSCKYFKDSVLIEHVVSDNNRDNETDSTGQNTDQDLHSLLSQAGLSGVGLDKLCRLSPPLELPYVRAVVLYAQMNKLGPGYIYRHLEGRAEVAGLFTELAQLDEATLALFHRAAEELADKSRLIPAIQSVIPGRWVALFTRFAQAQTGLEPPEVQAALQGGRAGPDGSTPEPEAASSPARQALDQWWERALERLQTRMTQATFDTWVKNTRLVARQEAHLTVAVQSTFARDWLEHRLYATVRQVVESLLQPEEGLPPPDVTIDFVVDGPKS